MKPVRHIVFDIGNVLIRWDPENLYRRLIPDETERRNFLATVCTPAWNLEQDRGRTWPEAEAVLIAEYPEHEELIKGWRRHWHEMVPGEVDGTAAILDGLLAGGHDVTALTNFETDTFNETRDRFPKLTTFRGTTVSALVKLVKPDVAIYHRHAADFGLDPAATLFFDDNPANVEGARAAGWNAERFVDANTMRTDLARYGIRLP